MEYSNKDLRVRDMSYLKDSNINKKEFFESKETLDKSIKSMRKFFGVDRLHTIYDFCSGHSFSCYYALTRDMTKFAVSIDILQHNNTFKIASYYPQFSPRVVYKSENIFTTNYKLESLSLVLAIHPCKDLVFRVIEIAIENKLPVVVVPCCKGGKIKSWVDSFPNLSDYERYSMKVAEFLSSKNYNVSVKTINKKYTPRNFIIMGTPR